MCGIFGVLGSRARPLSITLDHATRLRDMLTHRGPDGAGVWAEQSVVLAHRRLAVIDPTDRGAQPMATPDGRFVLVYNGELYNDAELRRDLAARAVRFRTTCDTETVLHALATWGLDALTRFRGMFALALYDTRLRTLTLARDPLGVKPLYFWHDERELVFASEPGPILAHPRVTPAPNLAMVSAYLTTIRTVLENDTLFAGVHALAPGQAALCDVSGGDVGGAPVVRIVDYWRSCAVQRADVSEADAALDTRAAIRESVALHLRSDVPTCALLSGGLDSAVVTSIARAMHDDLRTYCAGAPSVAEERDDLSYARELAHYLNTRHDEAIVTRESFARRWPAMVREMGVPLSTPNEVAIHAVASRLRADGCIVTLSGEGADELFAGYEGPMLAALAHTRRRAADPSYTLSGGRFELLSNAWIAPDLKRALLREEVSRATGADESLFSAYDAIFDKCAEECGAPGDPASGFGASGGGVDPLEAHLRFHRRVNLTGLLQRLDTATMLASVEGRTPYADCAVALIAESMPMSVKFAIEEHARTARGGDAPPDDAPQCRTKIALREAFRDALPREVIERPKASFPLPFQGWLADNASALRDSSFARAIFTDDAVETVSSDPARHWRCAWPMTNIAMWGDRWWGG